MQKRQKNYLTKLSRIPKTALITVSTEADEFNESEFSVKEAIYNAIENEVQDNCESPIFDCGFSVKEVTE